MTRPRTPPRPRPPTPAERAAWRSHAWEPDARGVWCSRCRVLVTITDGWPGACEGRDVTS